MDHSPRPSAQGQKPRGNETGRWSTSIMQAVPPFSQHTALYQSIRPSTSMLLLLCRHVQHGLTTSSLTRKAVHSSGRGLLPHLKACYPVRPQKSAARWRPGSQDKGQWVFLNGSNQRSKDSNCYSDVGDAWVDSQWHCQLEGIGSQKVLKSELIPDATERARTCANVGLGVPAAHEPHTMLTGNARGAWVLLQKRSYICQSCLCRARGSLLFQGQLPKTRAIQTTSRPPPSEDAPFRKVLKDAAKQKRRNESVSSKTTKEPRKAQDAHLEQWELTVGIEIHAELNTARKLFSGAATSVSAAPNAHVALFDTAFPGTQPHFQKETLLPAIRAALALNCEIQPKCSFDRKHYFYQDQPAGYQITQYYGKFALDLLTCSC